MDALNYIDGRHVPAAEWLENFEPATGTAYGRVASSDAADVERAVAAAARAFPAWSATPAAQRSRVLRALARLIERDKERLARAETVDTGKPVTLAGSLDIPRAAQNFEFFADAITQWQSEAHPTDEVALNYTLRQPLGVVACISPWNLPLYLLTWKVAPALAAGNCVVAKPSEVTPMTAHLLGELCSEAGLPPGVLNIVQGLGPRAGSALVAHPDVRAVSFTGSTRVGREIAGQTAQRFVKEAGCDAVKLERGGSSVQRARAIVDAGIPVMGHVGLTPQTATALGGYRAQGRWWSAPCTNRSRSAWWRRHARCGSATRSIRPPNRERWSRDSTSTR